MGEPAISNPTAECGIVHFRHLVLSFLRVLLFLNRTCIVSLRLRNVNKKVEKTQLFSRAVLIFRNFYVIVHTDFR